MAGVRFPEEKKRIVAFVNDPVERATARAIQAASLDESKRPVSLSSSLFIKLKEHDELQNNQAIAALIVSDIAQAEDDADCESSHSDRIAQVKPLSVILHVPTWMTLVAIPGIDELPKDLLYICLAYADYLSEAKVTYQYPKVVTYIYSKTSFFSLYISQLQYHLGQAANELLCEGKIDKALALIEQNKDVINIETQGKDRFGTFIQKKTLLQMAGMLGDVNLTTKKESEEKKDNGAVELFAKAAGLTDDEVAHQLFPVLFSKEAKKESEERKQRVLNVFREFEKNIFKKKVHLPARWFLPYSESDYSRQEFEEAKTRCRPEINKLRKDLLDVVSNQTVKSGYILDYHIIDEFVECYVKMESIVHFGTTTSLIADLIWMNSYSFLQYVAAARDAHIHREGTHFVVNGYDGGELRRTIDAKEIPARTLKNNDGSSFFDDSLFHKVGDVYIGFAGRLENGFPYEALKGWEFCIAQRQQRLENLCNVKSSLQLK